MARRRRVTGTVFTFYNPRTGTWYRAKRLKSGKVRIMGRARVRGHIRRRRR